MTMVDVSFKDYNGPVKNPMAGGSRITIEREVTRIVVSVGGNTTPRHLKVLAEVIRANKVISPAIVNDLSAQLQHGLGFDQYLARQKQIARTQGASAQVEAMVRKILATRHSQTVPT